MEATASGSRVEITYRLLEPEGRAHPLPDDTARLPYEVRARGVLLADCMPGDEATIRTPAGRVLGGVLTDVEPADSHTFGRPQPALVEVIVQIQEMLQRLQ